MSLLDIMLKPECKIKRKDGSYKNGEIVAYMVRTVLVLWPDGEKTQEDIEDIEPD